MNTALVSGLIILVLLIIMLIAGVPIAVALGVSSVCAILPIMDLNVAVLTGCQDKYPCKYVIRFYFRIWYSSSFCYGIYHRTNRERRGI